MDYETLLKQKELELLRRQLDLRRDNGLLFYRPHPKQDAFHSAGRFVRRMVRAGNRFGKSQMGAAEDVAWALGERIWYPEGDPRRFEGIPRRGIKLLIITTDWDLSESVFTREQEPKGKLFQLLPKDKIINTRKNHSGKIDTIEVQGRWGQSVIKLETVQSFKTNPMGVESLDWDAIHVDEPCPQAMWKGAARGLVDRDGSAWFTLTPLREPWINDMFFPEGAEGMTENGGSIFGPSGTPELWSVTGAMDDNPYLTPEAIHRYAMDLTEEERECRIRGLPMHLAGLVYKEFDRAKHVMQELPDGWLAYNQPPRNWPKYFYIDPHPQTPHAVLFITVDPVGRWYVYDEFFRWVPASDLARMIKARLAGHWVPRFGRCDPAAWQLDPVTRTQGIAQTIMENGVLIEKAVKDLESGIPKAREVLAKRPILVSPTCVRFLWEIGRYSWDDKNGEQRNKPVDKDDHMMENFYRACLDEPQWCERTDDRTSVVEDMEISTYQDLQGMALEAAIELM